MNFKEYIETIRSGVYSTICGYIQIKEPEEHYRMVRDYIDRQGSYRRPGLLMLSGEMFGAKREDLFLPAAAMQLSEDWILIHDDIEDHSEMRRGKPALQKIHGYELAINAGDGAHMTMWKIMKDYMLRAGQERGSAMYDKFYDMLEYTVEGQYIEDNFIYNVKEMERASEELYMRIANTKTGYYTVYGPLQLGALAAGKNGAILEALEEIGRPAGIAFQIVDDILDMTADEKTFGKRRFGDLYEGKVTLIMLHTYQSATKEEKGRIDAIYRKRREEKSEDEINWLAQMVEKYDGMGYAKRMSERYGEIAKRSIEKHLLSLPDNENTKVLLSALEELYLRKK